MTVSERCDAGSSRHRRSEAMRTEPEGHSARPHDPRHHPGHLSTAAKTRSPGLKPPITSPSGGPASPYVPDLLQHRGRALLLLLEELVEGGAGQEDVVPAALAQDLLPRVGLRECLEHAGQAGAVLGLDAGAGDDHAPIVELDVDAALPEARRVDAGQALRCGDPDEAQPPALDLPRELAERVDARRDLARQER